MTLLGPSGCGKTTLLRIVAGFDPADRGPRRCSAARRHARAAAPAARSTWSSSAPTLFPHLDVSSNVAFGLRIARVGEAEAARAGRRGARAGPAGGLRAAPRARALRRADAAGRAGAGARQPAAGPAARRAALGARPEDPARDGGRAAAHPPRDRRDLRLRHARPARGARAVGPGRRLRRGPDRPGRHAGRRSTAARPRRSPPASSATRTCSRSRRRARDGTRGPSGSAARRGQAACDGDHGRAWPGSSSGPRSCDWPRTGDYADSIVRDGASFRAPVSPSTQVAVISRRGVEVEVTSEGQAVLLPLGSEIIGEAGHPRARAAGARGAGMTRNAERSPRGHGAPRVASARAWPRCSAARARSWPGSICATVTRPSGCARG